MRGMFGRFWEKRRKRGSVEVRPADVDASAAGIEEQGRNIKSKTWATSVSRVESWPVEARPLKQHTWISYLYLFFDAVLVLLPVFFILLSIAVITLDGKPTKGNDLGKKVEFVIDLGPTIFPIVFAAVSGRSMKMIARFLAERGAKISTLELLMASQSVWGTLESQLLMQRATLVGVNLLFLWALSPLGGQASLRLMKRGSQEAQTWTKLRYMTSGPGATMWGLATTYEDGGKFFDTKGLFTAALLAPLDAKIGPRDPWGNVKIPSLESLSGSENDSSEWLNVPANLTTPESYASLVGLPIIGLPRDPTSFSMEYTYLTVSCGNFSQTPLEEPIEPGRWQLDANWTQVEKLAPGYIWSNKTASPPWGYNPEGIKRMTTFFIDATIPNNWETMDNGRFDAFVGFRNQTLLPDESLRQPRKILYASKFAINPDGNDFRLNIGSCELGQQHVEAMVGCQGSECRASKIRKSLTDTRSLSVTGLDHPLIMSSIAQQFPVTIDSQSMSSPIERFLADSLSMPFLQQVGFSNRTLAYVDVSKIPLATFSKRLSLVMNTYYQLSMQPTGYFGSLPTNLSLHGPDTLPVTDIDAYLPPDQAATKNSFSEWWQTFSAVALGSKAPFIGATANATVTSTEEIFVCNYAWLALLWTSSSILFLTGSVALVLKRKTLGPEMFGFVSSMTYENPWVKIPSGGSMLDAMERSRLLRDVKVCIGDVHGNEDEGHIALAAGVPLRKLERGRRYA
ncbi:hypothetical protein BU24DRAFT_457695 [Aaosphaeria arxii CBS 175.79]|uniref:Uncharacterized protein n=1 Tax=Aaosphaeria arxii CBS 175.79 TaxID=1450172 RepID=A0A6A5YAG6_9PLEO|nr:uncharacterized protein BU24DRAFT_457695 [Aaosphaeria arxii CBS 175.79]KAF2021751.1 hypothetical protein BU24DRAFT_457695 [Aaosphaeria arxii CBS 175.79]